MIDGARQLPTMHLSVRVPWHDGRWSGNVCSNPTGNTSCLSLSRIANNRDDERETAVAGQPWSDEGDWLPACAAERGAFMAPFGYVRRIRHPYSHDPLYRHFRESFYRHAPYSAAAVPFDWMMKDRDGIPARAREYGIGFDPELEPRLKFDTTWVQERRNQLAMLDSFFSAVKPNDSLVFFYTKRTPLTEDRRRVIVGLGRVRKVDQEVEYEYVDRTSANALRCVLWERNVHHSIRPQIDDGFLLPYHDLIKLGAEDPDLDVASLVLHAPDEHRLAFSMSSEHVTHDQAIPVLLSCASLLGRIEAIVPGNWGTAKRWIDTQLNRIWRLRGPYPGLGSALTALGLNCGTLVAHAVGQKLAAQGPDVGDPWPVVAKALHEPHEILPPDLASTIGDTAATLWDGLKPERLALLKLLARFEISADQAIRWFVQEERLGGHRGPSDGEILANPYLCFEFDRGRPDSIAVGTIDRGLFPDATISKAAPVPVPSVCKEPIDPRRVRGLIVATLDQAATEGHSLLPQSWLVRRVRDLELRPRCAIGSDWFHAFSPMLVERALPAAMADGTPAWQLLEYGLLRKVISTSVRTPLGRQATFGWL